jgi:hypothetical protein
MDRTLQAATRLTLLAQDPGLLALELLLAQGAALLQLRQALELLHAVVPDAS